MYFGLWESAPDDLSLCVPLRDQTLDTYEALHAEIQASLQSSANSDDSTHSHGGASGQGKRIPRRRGSKGGGKGARGGDAHGAGGNNNAVIQQHVAGGPGYVSAGIAVVSAVLLAMVVLTSSGVT